MKRFNRLLCVMMALLLLSTVCLTSCGDNEKSDGSDSEATETQKEEIHTVTKNGVTYNYLIDISDYEQYLDTDDTYYLWLVNKTHTLELSVPFPNPVSLVCPTLYDKDIQVDYTVAMALYAMLDEMEMDGVTDIMVTSGYRSYSYQERLFNSYIKDEMDLDPTLTEEEAREKVLTYSAEPGTSEHQTGLCVDFITNNMISLVNYGTETAYAYDVGFTETEAFAWLSQNAYRFGFILRFPSDKEDVTGYSYESWHYRYVGRTVATEIYQQGITLEEYLELHPVETEAVESGN